MGVRGLREIDDVDLIVTKSQWDALASEHQVLPHEHGIDRLQIGDVEVLSGWYPDVGPVGELIANAEMIDGLPFVRLGKVVEWKTKYGRPKDVEDLQRIRSFLSTSGD